MKLAYVSPTVTGFGAILAAQLAIAAVAPNPAGVRTGDPIDVATAALVAQQHLARLEMIGEFALGDARTICNPADNSPLCYCFDLHPCGYIIVTASTTLPPVMACSFTSSVGDLVAGNPLADLLRWDLELRATHADLLPAEVAARQRADWSEYLDATNVPSRSTRFDQWPPAGSTPTGGWILTNWTQNAPYNNLCPWDTVHGARSLAGCPAVAMAQILHYHARLNDTHFTDADDYYHNYGGNQFWIDNAYAARSFPSWPQLNTYLHTLFDSYFNGTAPTDTSKAALVYACGAAASQVYASNGSGTFGVSQAFDAYQKFGCSTAVLLDDSDTKVYTLLAENMMNAAPAHLAIVDPNWSTGHNVVVDGYNTDDYFHLNFGWGGSYNGWYRLPSGLPFNLTVLEGVVLNIMTDACAPMDCNCDAAVDWDDYTYCAPCVLGASILYVAPGCAAFDADGDHDVDLRDLRAFQVAYH